MLEECLKLYKNTFIPFLESRNNSSKYNPYRPIQIESDKTTSIYNVSTRVLSKK